MHDGQMRAPHATAGEYAPQGVIEGGTLTLLLGMAQEGDTAARQFLNRLGGPACGWAIERNAAGLVTGYDDIIGHKWKLEGYETLAPHEQAFLDFVEGQFNTGNASDGR